uniref:NADH-ubiquinone oxidoreductase chain 2 n=1 Tax=Calotes versicolor TaxID=48253 RepID=S5PUJ8_CALVC|nr:NADH dehydrogenase subunit 2 [Calotes versicolor]AGR90061.1 NADH dehydrogenase subunit 2 [Calotes versicolor]AGR90063.1 NADH dehydrogenase subunit 2 [Calotes versicolor]AGR90067.1 NADH dehydrogenase subunit 2 [Calotes versicolor]AGR90359.1 NADH dehydrogenase subunit 2 [Calotes versicolor]
MSTAMIFVGLILSTILATASNSWLLAWLCLELNTLSILPFISKTKHPRAIEAATKYFLTQATASCLLLLAGTSNAWLTGTWDMTQMSNKLTSTTMLIALTMKMGTVPTHFWLPEVLQGSTLLTALLISTWQKIAPMSLLFIMSNNIQPTFTLTLGLLSTAFGGWGGMNQTQLRKMMAYSSIANMGWTVITLTHEPKASMINIFTYITLTTPTFLLMALTSTKTLQNMTTMWSTSPLATTTMALLLLSTAGLPPLTGFLPKLIIMNELVTQNLTPLATMTMMTSLLSLSFYLRTTYLTTLLNPPSSTTSATKWRQKMTKNKTMILLPTATASTFMMPALIP